MALYAYLKQTILLIADLKQQVSNPANLISYVNIARRQLAGESESVRVMGSLPLVAGTQTYAFSTVTLPGSGLGSVLNARMIWVVVGGGQAWVTPRGFEYFGLYFLNKVVPLTGLPTDWAQFGQGVNGTLYFYPIPDNAYTVKLDTVCLPIDLALDTDVEAIPSPWTDAIPYYAAYLAYSDAQRPEEAQTMFARYEQFVSRARRFATPSVLSGQYEQQSNPVRTNQLGLKPPPKAVVQ